MFSQAFIQRVDISTDRSSEPSMSASLQDAHHGEDSYSDSDSASDSLNIANGNDEGWEDVEDDGDLQKHAK